MELELQLIYQPVCIDSLVYYQNRMQRMQDLDLNFSPRLTHCVCRVPKSRYNK